MNPLVKIITCILLVLTWISGCSSPGSQTGTAPNPTQSENPAIVCEVFHRSQAGERLEASPQIIFFQGNQTKTQQFDTIIFKAQFQDDAYEGRSLILTVTDLQSGVEVLRQLYQFDSNNPVRNQFIGGHGFTGLNYVFQPDSSAELQYFCSLN